MKKIILFTATSLIFFLLLFAGCKQNSPSSPVPAVPTGTWTISPTFSVSSTATITPTISETYTVSPTATVTCTVTLTPTISYAEFVNVPGATFLQADTAISFNHTVSSFSMAKYEVTYELWRAVYQWALLNGYYFSNAGREGDDGSMGAQPTSAKFEPVSSVTWCDMLAWCNAYSQKNGLSPVYYTDIALTVPLKDVRNISGEPYANWTSTGFRLPTEGEWMLAASYKDGSSWTPYNYASGATADVTDAAAVNVVAWYADNSGNHTHNVGTKAANALGIYDMSGNICEFVWDIYAATYPADTTDYRGASSGMYRVVKGYLFNTPLNYIYLGLRDGYVVYINATGLGFRLARTN